MTADSTEPLERQILDDARKRVEPIRKRAQREAEDIIRQARKTAQRERAEILDHARARAEVETRRARAQTELKAVNIQRMAREKVLQGIRERAAARLQQFVSSPEYPDILLRLASAALDVMEGRNFELVMNAESKRACGEGLAEALRDHSARKLGRQVIVRVADEAIAARGGLVVRTADGRQVCDQTFAARLERLWEELRDEAGGKLFRSE